MNDLMLPEVRIPWEGRRDRGRLRAFGHTVWLATFKTQAFCGAVAQPVSYRDARRFQAVVVVAMLLCPLLGGLLLLNVYLPSALERFGGWAAWGFVVALVTGWVLFLIFATGVQTYWLHPRQMSVAQQNRAVALGYYACAPLAFSAVGTAPLLLLLMGFLADDMPDWLALTLAIVGGLLVVLGIFASTRVVGEMFRHLAGVQPGHWAMLLHPLSVALLAALLLILLPASVVFVYLVVMTLRLSGA